MLGDSGVGHGSSLGVFEFPAVPKAQNQSQ